VLIVLPALLIYPRLGFPLLEPDESRYAQIPAEMIARNDAVVPRLQGEPYLDKPPLFYWQVALSYRLAGVSEGAARLVPALAVHGCVLLSWFFGRRWLGETAAWRGAILLAVAPGLVTVGRLLLLDSLLAFWTTLALFAGYEARRGERLRWGWWLVAAAGSGLGTLAKGPVALLLVLPPLWLDRVLHRRAERGQRPLMRPGRAAWVAFALVVGAIALPWYVTVACRIPGFVRYFLWEHHVMRFLTAYAHAHGVWFYGPVLVLGLLPALPWLVPFIRFLLNGSDEAARSRPAELGFLLLAGGWCVFFFTLSTGKLPTYVLPAFPPLALALGHFLAQPRWTSGRSFGRIVGLAFGLLLLLHHAALPWYAEYRSPMRRGEEVRRYCADLEEPVVCYPRNCDSVAFALGRSDLNVFRSKEIEELRTFVRTRPRTVLLCTHRHALRGLKQLLPPEVKVVEETHFGLSSIPGVPKRWMGVLARLMGETALGLCDVAVVTAPPPYRHVDEHRQAKLLHHDRPDDEREME
jgi:4-amino-4-deoxy-L-arabinose transferase-like glycosyltransferase